jgi:histidinol phosphatase-like PHP family hydrolase
VCILGDLTADAEDPESPQIYRDLLEDLGQAIGEPPCWIVRGNHDLPASKMTGIDSQGLRIFKLGDLALACFDDRWDAGDVCTRPAEQLAQLESFASEHTGPLVALQHNPIHPPIDADYPYMPVNREQIMRSYRKAGVDLSLSGHFHEGQPLRQEGGVKYATVGALCDEPYSWAILTLHQGRLELEQRSFRLPPGLTDSHVHTQLAYCSGGIEVALAHEVARRVGLSGLVLAEHAPQLYCSGDDFWQGRHIQEPRLWREGSRPRMEAFRRLVDPLRGGWIRAGLEVELDARGDLTLQEVDRDWPDVLLGALHWVPHAHLCTSRAEEARRFLEACEQICQEGIDILAHPVRWLVARENPMLGEMFDPLAQILADTRVAAEINFHKAPPPDQFVEACLKRGVKFTLGSDAHTTGQVGLLGAHVELLKRVSGQEDISSLLYCALE